MDIEELVEDARHWLDRHRPLRKQTGRDLEPGDPFSTAVFHALGFDEEKALLAELRSWQQLKAERGYHAIGWPTEVGGLGLRPEHAAAYGRVEAAYETPRAPRALHGDDASHRADRPRLRHTPSA